MVSKKLTAACKGCGAAIGGFANEWIQIGKNYFSPCGPVSNLNVADSGEPRPGELNTFISGCMLQDIACHSCRAIVGLRCISTVADHILSQDQLLLRGPSLEWKASRKGASTEFMVTGSYKLRDRGTISPPEDTDPVKKSPPPVKQPLPKISPVKPASTARASPAKHPASPAKPRPTASEAKPRATSASATTPVDAEYGHNPRSNGFYQDRFYVSPSELDEMKGEIRRIDAAGFQVVAAFDKAVSRIDQDIKKAHETYSQMDTKVASLQHDVAYAKSGVTDIRAELLDKVTVDVLQSKIAGMSNNITSSVSPIRKEVDALKALVKTKTSQTEALKTEVTSTTSELRDTKKKLQEALSRVAMLEKDAAASKKAQKELFQAIRDQTKQFTSLHKEMEALKSDVDASKRALRDSERAAEKRDQQCQQEHQHQQQQQQETRPVAGLEAELDILTHNLASVGTKAAMVETLQMEFQLFKARFQRLEQLSLGSSSSAAHQPALPAPQRSLDTDRYQSPTTWLRTSTPPDQRSSAAARHHISYSAPRPHAPRLIQAQPPAQPQVQMRPRSRSSKRQLATHEEVDEFLDDGPKKRTRVISASLVGEEDDDDDNEEEEEEEDGEDGVLTVENRAGRDRDVYRWSPTSPGVRRAEVRAATTLNGQRRTTRKAYSARKD